MIMPNNLIFKTLGLVVLTVFSVALYAGSLTITANANNQFFLDMEVNGEKVRFLVDTGASKSVLRYEDAQRAGVEMDKLKFKYSAQTANGKASFAATKVKKVAINRRNKRRNVLFYVANKGMLTISLLGMDYMSKFRELEVKKKRIRISY